MFPDGHLERRKIDQFERMTLLAVPPLSVPLVVVETTERINAMLARPLGVDLLRTLEPKDAEIFQAVSRFAPLSRLEEFAKELLASRADCRLLARLFPGDAMARLGLPGLAD